MRSSTFMRVLSVLALLLVSLSPFTTAAADAEAASSSSSPPASGTFQTNKQAHTYTNVREDLVCRACVAVAGDYFANVLPSMRARYGSYVEQKTASGVPYRERMIAELHESVDGLCKALKARHAEAHAAQADGAKKPLSGSTKDLDEALDIACPSTLEAIDDALTHIAFAYLLPEKFPTDNGDAGDRAPAQSAYALPKAGAFCEEQKQCLPYVHYHITSIPSTDSDGKKASLTKDEHDSMERGLREQREKRRHPEKPEEVPGARDDDDDEPTLLETLKNPETYTMLPQRVPWETITSLTFWKWTLHYMFRDSSVQFHLQERFEFVMGVAVGLFVVFVATIWICCSAGSTRKVLAPSTYKSAHVPAESTTETTARRRAPARKEA